MVLEPSDLKKIIESCHLNFLIGSGASMPFLKILGNVETQLSALASRADSISKENYQVIDASIKQYYFENCIQGNIDIPKGGPGALDEVIANYKVLISSLNTILSKRRNNLVSKQVNVFTTNMDMFLDWCLEETSVSYNDGFSGRLNTKYSTTNFHNTIRKTTSHFEYHAEIPHFNLFKLHGSVNWKLQGTHIVFDYTLESVNDILKHKLDKVELIRSPTDDLSAIIESLDKNPITLSSNHTDFLEAYQKLIMINPTKDKFETTTRDLTFYELLRMYSNHLERENSVLFVIGFSFADEHIREITKRVVAANPTLLTIVFAHTKAAKESIELHLGNKPNIRFIWDETDSVKYSLDKVNDQYFRALAEELLLER